MSRDRRISVIIPSRCDAAALGRTVDALTVLSGIERAEVIVAAWGDQAGTDRAVAGRARVLWPGGCTRAALMNAGGKPFVVMGKTMGAFVVAPQDLQKKPAELKKWLSRSIAYASSLPPKAKKKKKA